MSLPHHCPEAKRITPSDDEYIGRLAEFESHYHEEQNLQGWENLLIDPGGDVGNTAGIIECRERLGGLLRCYHRRAD